MNDQMYFSFIGRLTRDAELRYTSAGTAIANFSIACNEEYKDKKTVHYFDIELWGKIAEALGKYLTKGTQVAVSGTPKQERWQDKSTGQTRSKIKFAASNIQLLGSKPAQQDNQNNQNSGYDFDDPWRQQ